MRVVRREAERAVDPRLELLGDHVLEAVGLVVDVVDVDAERLGEVELEQANATLEDDLRVSSEDGRVVEVPRFEREELLKPLEKWFFGRR